MTQTPADAVPLATAIQRDAERLALRIIDSAPVRAAKAEVRQVLAQDPVAATPQGAATLDRAIDWWALSLALRETVGDVERPAFVWPLEDTPRRWFGHDVPGASVGGVANPDNVYRNAFIDGARHYQIRGRRHPNGPQTFSIELARQEPGVFVLAPADGKLEADLGDQLGILTERDIVVEADGSFVVTLSPEPAAGRRNHLQTAPGPLALNHRDTLADWRQVPNALEIALVGSAPLAPTPSEDEIVRRTATHLPGYIAFWTPFRRQFLGAPAPNSISPVFPRDGGWGQAAGGRYALGPDEALVLVTRTGGAAYTGVQIADAWMMAPDARRHQTSLNNHQAIADADGRVTYVIALADPGIANWIDPGGYGEGWYMLRWQDLSESIDPATLVDSVKLVRLDELDRVLDGVARVDAVERARRLAARAADYATRIGQ
ncbi:MAG: hypothetical protein JWR77_125 [Rhizorhabdus sp.]|nr:hypothetical protein [Rhizorhabdus sp.]